MTQRNAKETAFSENGHEPEAKLELVRLLFDTPEDKLAELSNIPLNLVLPLSMLATIEDGVKMVANRIEGTKQKPILLSERFRMYFAQYRRSIPGIHNHKQSLAELTSEELQTRNEEDKDDYEDQP